MPSSPQPAGMRAHRCTSLLLLSTLAASLPLGALAQTCGNIDALAAGRAAGNGVQNDTPALARMDGDGAVGLIYLRRGRYRLATSLNLRKPLMCDAGAVLQVDAGVTLTIQSQPECGLARIFDVKPGGKVVFGYDTVRTFPEWWGAAGNGAADDAPAIQAAFDAAAASSAAMLYLSGKTYGLGREVTFTNGANVMSEPSARFVAVGGNRRGVTFPKGGYSFKNVLPHFSNFADWCVRLLGADLGAFQLKTLTNCGDAIRLETVPPREADTGTVLDNTIWFESITNARVAVAIRAADGCGGDKCIIQGNQVLGSSVSGCAPSGQSATVGFFYPTKPMPAWDSNQFNLAAVNPCKNNRDFSMWYSSPGTETAREVLRIGSLGAVGPGASLFGGRHLVLSATIHLREEQPAGAGELKGLANLVELSGATTPRAGAPPIKAATRPRSQGSFNGGKALFTNFVTLRAVPEAAWPAGESQVFYAYHQLATGEQYTIKCDAPRLKATNLPLVSCLQVQDNSRGGSQGEIQMTLINLTGQTIPAGSQRITFSLAVGTLGTP